MYYSIAERIKFNFKSSLFVCTFAMPYYMLFNVVLMHNVGTEKHCFGKTFKVLQNNYTQFTLSNT